MMSDLLLDLRGLKCPMPVLRTRKALSSMRAGATILVQCTDPLAGLDLPHLIRETGDRLVECIVTEDGLAFRIQKSEGPPV